MGRGVHEVRMLSFHLGLATPVCSSTLFFFLGFNFYFCNLSWNEGLFSIFFRIPLPCHPESQAQGTHQSLGKVRLSGAAWRMGSLKPEGNPCGHRSYTICSLVKDSGSSGKARPPWPGKSDRDRIKDFEADG